MNSNPHVVEMIFLEAIERESPEARHAYLNEACAGDIALRRLVEELLRAHGNAGIFLEGTPGGLPQSEAPSQMDSKNRSVPSDGMAADASGGRIGRYKLIERIGEGGYGTVFLAEQEEPLRREVALKVIKLGMDTRSVIARFEAERQALAMMDHPNIARILDAGVTDATGAQFQIGRPYFVMELVRGAPITRFCDEQEMTVPERIHLFIQVCQAIQHAHQKGVIHRDIKPSNILVGVQEGRPAPKVIDFGIAKAVEGRLTDHTLVTAAEQFIGTPTYMSPEQADRGRRDVDTRSDIYSLGVVLYELLTGLTPFDARELMSGGFEQARRTLLEVEPPTPSIRLRALEPDALANTARQRRTEGLKLPSGIRGDLDWIVMKCLEKDRGRRYETANGLAADLRRHLGQEPVLAGPPGIGYRLSKGIRRYRLAVATVGLIALTLLGATGVSTWQAIRATRAVHRAEQSESRTREALYLAVMKQAPAAWEAGNSDLLRALLTSVSNAPNRGFEWRFWNDRLHEEWQTLGDASAPITTVAFTGEGRHLVTKTSTGAVTLWDTVTGRTGTEFGESSHWEGATEIAVSRSLVAFGDSNGVVRLFDHETGRERTVVRTGVAPLHCLALSSDGRRMLVSAAEGYSQIWEVAGSRKLFTLSAPSSSASFSPDGQVLVTMHGGVLRLWDGQSGIKIASHPVEAPSERVSFSADGSRMLCSDPRGATLRDPASGRVLETLDGQARSVTTAELSPDGRWVATGDEKGTLRLYDTGGRLITTFRGHSMSVMAVAFSPDGRLMVTGSRDGTAKVWSLPADPPLLAVRPGYGITALAAAPDETRIASAGSDGVARIWDFATGRELLSLRGHAGRVNSVIFSPDGAQLISCGEDRIVRIWNATTGHPLATLPGHTSNIVDVAVISREPWRLLTAGASGELIIWDPAAGGIVARFSTPSSLGGLHGVAVSEDGRLVAAAGEGGRVWVGERATGTQRFELEAPAPIRSLAFSPDGRRLAAAGLHDQAFVWDLESPDAPLALSGHVAPLETVRFLDGGRRLVTTADDDTVRIWDTATGLELVALGEKSAGSSRDVRSALLAISSDGQRILFNRNRELRVLEGPINPKSIRADPPGQRGARAPTKRSFRPAKGNIR
ncbi:MAG: protein kinase [Verrucomicrobiales bacterium]|nr:protein kinase [Verrucomicrobiales bacterium]